MRTPTRWRELKDLIDELLEAKSVVLGFQSSLGSTPDGRRRFRLDGLVYDRQLTTGSQARAFNYEYGWGQLEASEPIPGGDRIFTGSTVGSAFAEGVFEASNLEAVHHKREGPKKPQELTFNPGRGQSKANFDRILDEVARIQRLFSEVLPEVDPLFRASFSKVVADIQKQIDTYWVHHPTVRADVWLVPVERIERGQSRWTSGVSSTATFDMTADKAKRLRELAGSGSIDLPVLLFEVDQPKNTAQQARVLADERLLSQLVSQLREVERRSGPVKFVVYGYADGWGSPEHNRKLAEDRAKWTVLRLKDHGLHLDLKPVGCGDRHARIRTGNRLNAKQRAVLLVEA